MSLCDSWVREIGKTWDFSGVEDIVIDLRWMNGGSDESSSRWWHVVLHYRMGDVVLEALNSYRRETKGSASRAQI